MAPDRGLSDEAWQLPLCKAVKNKIETGGTAILWVQSTRMLALPGEGISANFIGIQYLWVEGHKDSVFDHLDVQKLVEKNNDYCRYSPLYI